MAHTAQIPGHRQSRRLTYARRDFEREIVVKGADGGIVVRSGGGDGGDVQRGVRERGEKGEDGGGGDEVEHGVVDEVRARGWGRFFRVEGMVGVWWWFEEGGGNCDVEGREGGAELGLRGERVGVGAEGEGGVVA